MKVIFDCEFDHNGLIVAQYHMDSTDPKVIATLTGIANGTIDPTGAGFAVQTKLPGQPDGTTRWKVMVNEANKAAAPQELKALNLKDIAMAVQPAVIGGL